MSSQVKWRPCSSSTLGKYPNCQVARLRCVNFYNRHYPRGSSIFMPLETSPRNSLGRLCSKIRDLPLLMESLALRYLEVTCDTFAFTKSQQDRHTLVI